MMNVNGEKVWVPHRKNDLIQGLKRMGVSKVAGMPLRDVPKRLLVKEYCRTRAMIVRRKQRERAAQLKSVVVCPSKNNAAPAVQLRLF